MSNVIIYLGPESTFKNSSIKSYSETYPNFYALSTLDLHLMFNIFNFKDYGDTSPMTVTFKCFQDIIKTLTYKQKDVIIKDWYFGYPSLEYVIKAFDEVRIRIFDTPLESYLKFYHQSKPWHKKLPDILDEIEFYDKFKTFLNSPLFASMKERKNITISGIKASFEMTK